MAFDVSAPELSAFVRLCFDYPLSGQVREKVLPALDRLGGAEGLVQKLKSHFSAGIAPAEVAQRELVFGKNYVEPDPPDTLLELAWEALQDPCLIFLCFAASVSFIVGIVFDEGMEWIEGMAILAAVFVVVAVTSINNYKKDQQFRALSAVNDNVTVTVIRRGEKRRISTYDVVVGDIVLLSAGDEVCADGVIFEKNDIGISEASLTGESVLKRKGDFVYGEGEESAVKCSPAVFAGTMVQEGQGRMLVLAVGSNTYQGLMEQKMAEDEDEKTVLQSKLDDMTDLITKAGAVAGAVTVGILLVRFGLAFASQACCKEVFDPGIHLLECLRFLVVGVTVFVVAVPEGLPLAVAITLSLSVGKMQNDNCLVRHLSSCETMGSATTICSDKTGTLTTGQMTVVKVWCGGQSDASVRATLQRLSAPLQRMLAEAVVINSSFKSDVSWTGKGDTAGYVNTGNDTECAMLVLATHLLNQQEGSDDKHAYLSIRRKFPMDDPQRATISFSSARKRMSTLVAMPDSTLRLFCKGASEIVLGLCSQVARPDGKAQALSVPMRKELEKSIGTFADEGLRTIAVAYRDYDTTPDMDDEAGVEEGLTLVALLGLEDPVRPEVPAAVQTCKEAGIVVRMVTGDNPRTAVAIAKKCGILSEHADSALIMTGSDFREKVIGDDGDILQDEFDKLWMDLRVLARSSPIDKLTLVTGIQNSQASTPQVVAVTGDGTNDAPALKRANIGFAMNSGTQVAWKASDIVIMNDNFASVVEAVKWGRCVYDNICKFLQFQLTVNLTACVIAVVGASILTRSPLNVIQLLWVNMIMDSFASLALATEDPKDDLLKRNPYPRDQQLLSPNMLRSLICHSAYQLFVLFVVIFAVGDVCPGSEGNVCTTPVLHRGIGGLRSGRPAAFDKEFFLADIQTCLPVFNASDQSTYTWVDDKGTSEGCANCTKETGADGSCHSTCVKEPKRPTDYCQEAHSKEGVPNQHNAIVFTVFVMMQLFNQLNARKLHGERNVFSGVLANNYFLAIMCLEFGMQVVMVELPGLNLAMGCASMSFGQWMMCVFVGATELAINPLIQCIPTSWLPSALVGKKCHSSEQGDGVPLLERDSKRSDQVIAT